MMLNLGPTMEEVLQEASELTGKEVKLVAEGNSGGGALVAALAWAESVA
jgi:hypothetical protein